MTKKYRVTYEVNGQPFACEYNSRAEAERNRDDIAGYEGITNAHITKTHDHEPLKPGPFPTAPSRFDREDPI